MSTREAAHPPASFEEPASADEADPHGFFPKGDDVGSDEIAVTTLKLANATFILVQEATARLDKLAEKLDWMYAEWGGAPLAQEDTDGEKD